MNFLFLWLGLLCVAISLNTYHRCYGESVVECTKYVTNVVIAFTQSKFVVYVIDVRASSLPLTRYLSYNDLQIIGAATKSLPYLHYIKMNKEKRQEVIKQLNFGVLKLANQYQNCPRIYCHFYRTTREVKNKTLIEEIMTFYNNSREYRCNAFTEDLYRSQRTIEHMWLAVNFEYHSLNTEFIKNSHTTLILTEEILGVATAKGCAHHQPSVCSQKREIETCDYVSERLGLLNMRLLFFENGMSPCVDHKTEHKLQLVNGTNIPVYGSYIVKDERFLYCDLIARSLFLYEIHPWSLSQVPNIIFAYLAMFHSCVEGIKIIFGCEYAKLQQMCTIGDSHVLTPKAFRRLAEFFCENPHHMSFACIDLSFLYELLVTGLKLQDHMPIQIEDPYGNKHMHPVIGFSVMQSLKIMNGSPCLSLSGVGIVWANGLLVWHLSLNQGFL